MKISLYIIYGYALTIQSNNNTWIENCGSCLPQCNNIEIPIRAISSDVLVVYQSITIIKAAKYFTKYMK